MPESTPPKRPKRLLLGDDKVLFCTLHGRGATNWRELLRKEGGTESSHIRKAVKRYIKRLGYKTKPKADD